MSNINHVSSEKMTASRANSLMKDIRNYFLDNIEYKLNKAYSIVKNEVIFNGRELVSQFNEFEDITTFMERNNPKDTLEFDPDEDEISLSFYWPDYGFHSLELPYTFFDDFDKYIEDLENDIKNKNEEQRKLYENYLGNEKKKELEEKMRILKEEYETLGKLIKN